MNYNKIVNPLTGELLNISSKEGIEIIKNYVNASNIYGGSLIIPPRLDDLVDTMNYKNGLECKYNESTKRCGRSPLHNSLSEDCILYEKTNKCRKSKRKTNANKGKPLGTIKKLYKKNLMNTPEIRTAIDDLSKLNEVVANTIIYSMYDYNEDVRHHILGEAAKLREKYQEDEIANADCEMYEDGKLSAQCYYDTYNVPGYNPIGDYCPLNKGDNLSNKMMLKEDNTSGVYWKKPDPWDEYWGCKL